jgi:uncharacterized protein YdbL (DUF1318 family)
MIRAAIFAGLLVAVAPPAAAQTSALDAARSAGQIGERYDGYIGVVSTAPNAVRSQVAAVNIQRRTLYSRLAASRGVTPQDVGITAGCQLLARVGEGQAYMFADGAWRRRGVGQPAPVPDYCR